MRVEKGERTIVKPKEISNLIKEKSSVDVTPSCLILKENLNKVGSYPVDVSFHAEVKSKITIKIEKRETK